MAAINQSKLAHDDFDFNQYCEQYQITSVIQNQLYIGNDVGAKKKWNIVDGELYVASNVSKNGNNKSIRTIVNCTIELPNYHQGEFSYMRIALYDDPRQEIYSSFDNATQFIHSSIQSGKPVFVHCMAGISRSASIVIAYLMRYRRMKLHKAIKFLKNKRDIIKPNIGFYDALVAYERYLTGMSVFGRS